MPDYCEDCPYNIKNTVGTIINCRTCLEQDFEYNDEDNEDDEEKRKGVND